MTRQQAPDNSFEQRFFASSPCMLFPGCTGTFTVFLQQEQQFVTYIRAGEKFTHEHLSYLQQTETTEIYIADEDEHAFQLYMEEHLGTRLLSEETPLEERARIFHDTSVDIVRTAFENRLPEALSRQKTFRQVIGFVQEALTFLSGEKSFRTIARLISHDYRTYSHSVHVFLYSAAILQTYNVDKDELIQAGIGAMLHDIGKTLVSQDILSKTGVLTLAERRIINTHPLKGVSLCASLPLSQTAYNCILFHHEKLDGSGYPSGITKDDIPLAVRAVTIADIYDAMTTNRPYCSAMNPFQVLRMMRDEMFSEIDIDVFKRFVTILSGSRVI